MMLTFSFFPACFSSLAFEIGNFSLQLHIPLLNTFYLLLYEGYPLSSVQCCQEICINNMILPVHLLHNRTIDSMQTPWLYYLSMIEYEIKHVQRMHKWAITCTQSYIWFAHTKYTPCRIPGYEPMTTIAQNIQFGIATVENYYHVILCIMSLIDIGISECIMLSWNAKILRVVLHFGHESQNCIF